VVTTAPHRENLQILPPPVHNIKCSGPSTTAQPISKENQTLLQTAEIAIDRRMSVVPLAELTTYEA
jgi:hypothetical protein